MDEVFEHARPPWRSFLNWKETNRLEMLANAIETGTLMIRRLLDVSTYDDHVTGASTGARIIAQSCRDFFRTLPGVRSATSA
ncbi:hypothetical protein V1517DRAFT_326893 [Lipomyces orientalis]|uniref:Uncharacterized protein n=1 Tax=Lipomyces orientalis TaxID=1233043 RepID=A0ACC3TJH2_9ASCO